MRQIDNSTDTERETPAHSPLPWSADKWATGYTVSATDHSVCHLQDCNNDANAKLIVASVNHADKLAEALRGIVFRAQAINDERFDKQAEMIQSEAKKAVAAYESAQ